MGRGGGPASESEVSSRGSEVVERFLERKRRRGKMVQDDSVGRLESSCESESRHLEQSCVCLATEHRCSWAQLRTTATDTKAFELLLASRKTVHHGRRQVLKASAGWAAMQRPTTSDTVDPLIRHEWSSKGSESKQTKSVKRCKKRNGV